MDNKKENNYNILMKITNHPNPVGVMALLLIVYIRANIHLLSVPHNTEDMILRDRFCELPVYDLLKAAP